MKDWCTPRERVLAPDGRPKHYKKRGGKKPFIIERRYVGPRHDIFDWMCNREWHRHRCYKTEKARDQALVALNHKRENSHMVHAYWEYR